MDTPVTSRPSRPFFGRSHSATARLSPPQTRTLPLAPQEIKKRKHLHPLQTANERLHRHGHIHGHGHGQGERHGLLHSAIDHNPGQAIADLGRIASKTTSTNKHPASNHSRHDSPAPVSAPEPVVFPVPAKVIAPQDVEGERMNQEKREEELRATLNELVEIAHENTRRLDRTFAAIREKVFTIRSTIKDLQDLSSSSSELHQDFDKKTKRLEADTQKQILAFGNFEKQHAKIENLVRRVHIGVEKADGLSNRLETARGRVEVWEIEENEWQARTSQRLKMTWSCLVVFATFISFIFIVRQYTKPPIAKFEQRYGPISDLSNDTTDDGGPLEFINETEPNRTPIKLPSQNLEATDPRLNIFDEL